MTSALYLEHYLDSLQHLPVELQRNFKLMRDLDDRAHNIMRKIDLQAADLLPRASHIEPEALRERVNAIQLSFNKAKEYGDDKVQLAIQTYELVDKHIRRLDSDLARFEAEIQDKALGGAPAAEPERRRRRRPEPRKRSASSESEPRRRRRRPPQPPPTPAAPPTDVLDMPVDPNEPTYCLCHQVSYGEMIGCDNPDCPIEWFHFACVGLTTKPKGKWYCPKCSQDRKRK
ncbi:inhibitor of growth protein 5 [Arctopsyche grandis]|uniref:inhibitor of growth protein 5 n=1 Tax=Arctopsyche grandis TaxID=121162 RepID=UPI00406D655F